MSLGALLAIAIPLGLAGLLMAATGLLRDRARELIGRKRYKDGLGVLEKLPLEEMTAEDAFLMGKAANGLGDRPRAERLWRQSLQVEPTSATLAALWDLLLRSERKEDAEKLCASYQKVEALKAEATQCLGIVKNGGYLSPAKKP